MKYALEENNNGLICIFNIVHNKFNTITMSMENIDIFDICVALNDKESVVILYLLVHWSTDDRGFPIVEYYTS
jgi:hypothetical protein